MGTLFLPQMGAQYVTTIFLAQRSIESMVELDVGDLVWEESDTVKFSYFREVFCWNIVHICLGDFWFHLNDNFLLQKSRGASKNHYADIESCVDGGVIPNLYLTRGERAFNPAEVVQTYMSMRSSEEGDSKRLMMQAKQSVKYASHGCEPVIPSPKGQRFNLHDPEVKTCFMGGVNVMGKNLLRNLCPKLAEALRMPRVVNRDMRATAIQALRMAKFSTEEVCKISRHKQASTIERNYNIGLHSDQRADMAVAIAQAPLLKRGHEFQSVSEHLPRKTSLGQVQLANPSEMVPTRADKAQMVGKEVTVEERLPKLEEGVELFVDGAPWAGAEEVVEEEGDSSHSQPNLGVEEAAVDVAAEMENVNDR